MKQEDTILRFPKLCGLEEQSFCSSPLSEMNKAVENEDSHGTMKVLDQKLCSTEVPIGCPRVRCFNEQSGEYEECRRSIFVEGIKNEDGFWMRLPCGTCPESKKLHPTTKGFEYHE